MIRILQARELAGDLALVLAVVIRQTPEQIIIYLAVDVIDIDPLQPIPHIVMIPSKLVDPARMLRFHCFAAGLEGIAEPFKHPRSHRHLSDQLGHLFEEPLFPDIGLAAGFLVPAAAIINILLLLDVADQQPPTMPACNQASEQEILLRVLTTRVIPPIQKRLHLLP